MLVTFLDFNLSLITLTTAILVFQSSYNKLPLPHWLKTTHIYSLAVVEARVLKPRCHEGQSPSECSRGEPPLSSSWSWWVSPFLGSGGCGHITSIPSSLLTSSFPVLSAASLLCVIWTLAIRFKTYPCDIRWSPLKILNCNYVWKDLFCQIT